LVKGSTQGIAIEVNPTTNSNLESRRGNNYVSFWKNGEMTGRIEGMNTADLDPSGLVGLITKMVTSPPPGIQYKFGELVINLLPKVDVNASLDPFAVDVDVTLPNLVLDNPFTRLPGNFLEYIENPTGGPASFIFKNIFEPIACDTTTGLFTIGVGPEAATNFKAQIFSNYTLDVLTSSVVVFGSIVETVTSLASVADPEDIFSEALDFTVSNTHPSQMDNYFQGKNYSNRQEMLQDVKKALAERANINLDKYPLIAYMFDHPEQAGDMARYYNQVKETLSEVMEKR